MNGGACDCGMVDCNECHPATAEELQIFFTIGEVEAYMWMLEREPRNYNQDMLYAAVKRLIEQVREMIYDGEGAGGAD